MNVPDGIRAFKALARAEGVRRQRIVATGIYIDLVTAWPVDTGRSRAGWIATSGSPSTFVPPELAASIKGRKAKAGAKVAAISSAGGGIAAVGPKLGESIWSVNNVFYAVYLNVGHSPQMPAGTVEAIASKWQALGAQLAAAFDATFGGLQ